MKNKIKNNQSGFTLIEILIVVIILALLAGVVVPKMASKPEEARRETAKVQIKQIENALDMFKVDNGFYPSTEQGLQSLVTEPTSGRKPSGYQDGGYIKKIPLDPWKNEYLYLSPGEGGEYDLLSFGADGEPGGEGIDADINARELE